MARHLAAALRVSRRRMPVAPDLNSNSYRVCRLERPRSYCILPGLERRVDLLLCRIQDATGRLLH